MKELNLDEAFKTFSSNETPSDYISEIYRVLSEKGNSVDRKELDNIILKYGLTYTTIKKDLLNIILKYANLILTDGIISQSESFNLKYLKRLFKIEEEDFFILKNSEIKEIIQSQLYKLYFDKTIDNQEALYKAGLQELFDLSYEQMATFVNPVADEALEKGANISDLDTVFPNFNKKNRLTWNRLARKIGFKK
jgi:hypothetical protein